MDKSFGACSDSQLREDYIAVYKALQDAMPAKRPRNKDRIWARLIVQRLQFIAVTGKDEGLLHLIDQVVACLDAHLPSQVHLVDSPSEQAARSKLKSKTAQFFKSFKPKE